MAIRPISRRYLPLVVGNARAQLSGGAGGLNVLTIGPVTLRATMSPGDVVASISGKTPDSAVLLIGPAADAGLLSVNPEGTAIIVGPSGPGALDSSTGECSLLEIDGANSRTSGPFGPFTVTLPFRPQDNTAGAANYSDTSILDSFTVKGATSEQFILVCKFRLDNNPSTNRTVFGMFPSAGVSGVGIRLQVTTSGSLVVQGLSSSYQVAAFVASAGNDLVGEWVTVICQMNLKSAAKPSGHGTALSDRARAWVRGIQQVAQAPTMGGSNALLNGHGLVIGGASTSAINNVDMRFAFGWIYHCAGAMANLPPIRFDLKSERDKFEVENLDPVTGTVTLLGDDGNSYTITPDHFVHGTTAEFNAGTVTDKGAARVTATGLPAVLPKRTTTNWTASDFTDDRIAAADPTPVTATVFSQNNIDFINASPLTGGRFVMGDWWVNGSGGTSLTMNPASVVGDRTLSAPGAVTGLMTTGVLRYHGAMLDPSSAAALAVLANLKGVGEIDGTLQGFDAYDRQNDATLLAYRDALNICPGRTGTPINITSGTIVKAASRTSGLNNENKSIIADFAALTVLNGTPPTTTDRWFRPPVSSTVKDLWIRGNDADLDTYLAAIVPASGVGLSTPSGVSVPSGSGTYSLLKRIHTTWYLNHGESRNISANGYELKYGDLYAKPVGDALILLCLSAIPNTVKRGLISAIIQIAIDYAGMYEEGARSSATGLGGTSQGRKILLAVAAAATGNSRLLAASQGDKAAGFFPEGKATTTIITSDTTKPSNPYPAGEIGRGEWMSSIRDTDPNGSPPNYYWVVAATPTPPDAGPGVQYRHLWMTTMFAHYVAARILTGVRTAAGWEDFVSYGDYYWTRESSRGFVGDSTYNLTKPDGLFAKRMRETHTSYFP
jgi:hypothetical protein